MFSRVILELKSLVDGIGPAAQAGTVEQAVTFGDVVAIVVPCTAMQQIGNDTAQPSPASAGSGCQ